ncbi:hypothetical protein pipiens_013949 [Culex pipiens pipiens]|uniref:Uncharacterized protein n=1 Tax=Culex pipiens pipiens TaxID=38569 RepID=A0ABD1CWE8_CULPP
MEMLPARKFKVAQGGSRDGGATKEEAGEVLYSSAELWGIFSEYIGKFKTCKTRLDQVTLVSYMISNGFQLECSEKTQSIYIARATTELGCLISAI